MNSLRGNLSTITDIVFFLGGREPGIDMDVLLTNYGTLLTTHGQLFF